MSYQTGTSAPSQPTPWMPYQSYAPTYPLIINSSGNIYQSVGSSQGRSATSGGPTGTGTSITDNGCTWKFICGSSFRSTRQTMGWQALTSFAVGDSCVTSGNLYICTVAGTTSSASPPSGSVYNTNYTDGSVTWNYYGSSALGSAAPTMWGASTSYATNQNVINGPTLWNCTAGGTSGSYGPFMVSYSAAGPFGAATASDGGATWSNTSPATGGPSHTSGSASDGKVVWKFISAVPAATSSGGVYYPQFNAIVAEGGINGVLRVWWDKYQYQLAGSKSLTYTAPGTTSAIPFLNHVGSISNGVTAGNFPANSTYGSVGNVHTCSDSSTAPPRIAFEVQGYLATNAGDVNPADIVADLIESAERGCGLSSSLVDTSITGSGATTFRTYCDAIGIHLSLVLDQQRTALDILQNLLTATNSDAIYSQGVIKIVPLGDTSTASPVFGSNNFVPVNTPVYSLGVNDFTNDDQPVDIQRASPADTYNSFPIEYTDRSAEYADVTVDDPELADVDLRGLWRSSTTQLYATFPDATIPLMLSRIMAQRSVYCRNTYTFEVGWKYILLEPGDLVSLTEPQTGLVNQLVRITELEETPEGKITITAEDFTIGAQAVVPHTPVLNTGTHGHWPIPVSQLPWVVGGGGTLGIAPKGISKGMLANGSVVSADLSFAFESDEVLSGPTTTYYSGDTYTLANTPLTVNGSTAWVCISVGGQRVPKSAWTLSGTKVIFSLGNIPPGQTVTADYMH